MARTVTPEIYEQNAYMSLLIKASEKARSRVLIGVPATGLIRIEWALARWGQVIPTNWSASDCIQFTNQVSPLGYDVADARNIIVQTAIANDFEWLLFIDHDTCPPPDMFIKLNEYMRKGNIPVVSGLYFAKAHPAEPLIYRGRGNSYFARWKLGDKIWVDGVPMGCCLIAVALLKEMWNEAPEYIAGGNQSTRRVFDTPAMTWTDPEAGGTRAFRGTEDLSWCNRVIEGEFLKKAGWPKLTKKQYPFLVDTSIFCWHITEAGVKYPLEFKW